MAIVHVTGPAHVFIGLPQGFGAVSKTVVYLGTTQDTPRIVLRPASEEVMNALSGCKVPFDLIDQSEEAFIGLDLSRFNQGVIDDVRARSTLSNSQSVANNQGKRKPGDIGTLAITENADMIVYVTHPYSGKPVFAANGMQAGNRFLHCVPIGPDDLGPLSTRARLEHLMFRAIPGYDPVTGDLNLYDHVMDGLPPVN